MSLTHLKNFFLKEKLLTLFIVIFLSLIVYKRDFPPYTQDQLEVIFILSMLFIGVNGLQKGGLLDAIARKIERGRFISLKLLLSTFFLSMFVTNDISLIVIVPITLSLNIDRKDILVILEALLANAGSALSPIGNPQNLFIYWHYNLSIFEFVEVIAPFSIVFLFLLGTIGYFLNFEANVEKKEPKVDRISFIYSIILFIIMSSILHIIPIYYSIVAFLFAIIFDRRALILDYSLLVIFLLFFGIVNSLDGLFNFRLESKEHTFIFSVLISQIISNVPTALLFAKFTSSWKALLWGVNAGGFGSLFGSLANLIAYRLYIRDEIARKLQFTILFHLFNFIALFVAILLFFLLF